MKPEIEEALKNVEITCANARLNRDEHLILARNIQLLRETCEDKPEKEQDSKKKGSKDGTD